MISNVAAAGRAPWMVVTTIFAGAAISEIGKNYPKLKKRRTMALCGTRMTRIIEYFIVQKKYDIAEIRVYQEREE